jgi:hypothetical protein
MEQIIINLKESKKRDFLIQLLEHFEFVEIVKSTKNRKKAEFIQDFILSLEEVRLHQKGKIKLKPLKQALHEL